MGNLLKYGLIGVIVFGGLKSALSSLLPSGEFFSYSTDPSAPAIDGAALNQIVSGLIAVFVALAGAWQKQATPNQLGIVQRVILWLETIIAAWKQLPPPPTPTPTPVQPISQSDRDRIDTIEKNLQALSIKVETYLTKGQVT